MTTSFSINQMGTRTSCDPCRCPLVTRAQAELDFLISQRSTLQQIPIGTSRFAMGTQCCKLEAERNAGIMVRSF